MYDYEPSSNIPLSEQEAFAGTILGRKDGAQSKQLDELTRAMRNNFEAVAAHTVLRVVKGDQQSYSLDDIEVIYDAEGLERDIEALPRAIACLQVSVEGSGGGHRRLGELQSFKYIAAAVCLMELERSMGVLPQA